MTAKKKMREVIIPPGEGRFKKSTLKAAVEKVKSMSEKERQEALKKIPNKIIHIATSNK